MYFVSSQGHEIMVAFKLLQARDRTVQEVSAPDTWLFKMLDLKGNSV